MKKQPRSAGFGAVEIILIVVFVGLLGFLGYYLYTLQHNKSAPTQNTDTNAVQSAQMPSAGEHIEVDGWGVKVALRDYDKVQFEVRNQTGELEGGVRYEGSANPSFKPEFVADESCEPGAGLYRSTTSFGSERQEKKIGDYYYTIAGGPGACSDDPSDNSDDQLKIRFLQDFTLQNLSAL